MTQAMMQMLADPAIAAANKVSHNSAGLNNAVQGQVQVQAALDSVNGSASGQKAQLAGNASGQAADNANAAAGDLLATIDKIKADSEDITVAIEQAAQNLKLSESDVKDAHTTFVSQAKSIFAMAAAAKNSGNPAEAQNILVTQLAELEKKLHLDVGSILSQLQSSLTQVASQLSKGTKHTPKPLPSAFNKGGGGGGATPSGGKGGYASKPKLPVAIPPQPGSGVDINLPNGKTVQAPNETAAKAVKAALSNLGVPYVWGGTKPGVGLDCSGLTMTAYDAAGLDIPRKSNQQTVGAEVPSIDQLLPGDLVVWSGHVAMVIGDGLMIEAGDPVQIGPIRTTNAGQAFIGFFRPTG